MDFCGDGMKGNIAALLDSCVSGVDKVSLAIAINSFLTVPVPYEEALAFYTELLKICDESNEIISEPDPLRSRLLIELRSVSPLVITEKMRKYSLSIRRILADSIASSLSRNHDTLMEHIRDAVVSDSAADILALADKAVFTVPETNYEVTPKICNLSCHRRA